MKQNVDTERVVVRTCACNGVVERVRTSRVHAARFATYTGFAIIYRQIGAQVI